MSRRGARCGVRQRVSVSACRARAREGRLARTRVVSKPRRGVFGSKTMEVFSSAKVFFFRRMRTSRGEVEAVHGEHCGLAGDGVGRYGGCGFGAEPEGILRASRRRGREARRECRGEQPRADAPPTDRRVSSRGGWHLVSLSRLGHVSIYGTSTSVSRATMARGSRREAVRGASERVPDPERARRTAGVAVVSEEKTHRERDGAFKRRRGASALGADDAQSREGVDSRNREKRVVTTKIPSLHRFAVAMSSKSMDPSSTSCTTSFTSGT